MTLPQCQIISCISGIHLLIRCEVLHSQHYCQINRKVNDQRVRSFTNSISRSRDANASEAITPTSWHIRASCYFSSYFPLGDNDAVSRDITHNFNDYTEMSELSTELKNLRDTVNIDLTLVGLFFRKKTDFLKSLD